MALIAAAWALDMVTPQLFVAAILLNGPIALSGFAFDPRFTRALVGLALVANVVAGYFNGVADNHHWDALAVGDRTISGLSFLLVGGLSIAAQRSALAAGELASRQDRAARERGVRRAVEAIRSSVNPELIQRAVVREAAFALAVDEARLYVFEDGLDRPKTFRAVAGRDDVDVSAERPPAALLSFLQRVADAGDTEFVLPTAFGRLVLDEVGARHAVAAPLVERGSVLGVLIAFRRDRDFEPAFAEGLRIYVEQAALALAQAGLFVQLAERNEELALANAALRERSDVIRDIVYALSHDLRTPLAAAGLTMRQALDGAYGPLPDAYREIVRRTVASNDELQRLAETLLLVSRYESGENSPRRERVAALPLASDVAGELAPLWRERELDVRVEGDAGLETLADPGELRRALVNLIANAIAFTPPHATVVVRVGSRAEHVAFEVVDDGYGVPEAERAALFQRVRATPSRQGSGSGLGLYLVGRIAASHGGSVTYEPRPEGGSLFRLTMPAAPVAVRA